LPAPRSIRLNAHVNVAFMRATGTVEPGLDAADLGTVFTQKSPKTPPGVASKIALKPRVVV
jgi:hypothetical protein